MDTKRKANREWTRIKVDASHARRLEGNRFTRPHIYSLASPRLPDNVSSHGYNPWHPLFASIRVHSRLAFLFVSIRGASLREILSFLVPDQRVIDNREIGRQ
jgi:hypothetical protein